MSTHQRLGGRVAIITGGASGIGRATVELFAAEGASVVAVDLPGSAIASVHAGNPNIAALALNVTDADAPQKMVALALEKFGGLDILFNNAAVCTMRTCLPLARTESMAVQVMRARWSTSRRASVDATPAAIPPSRSHARIPVLFSRQRAICCILDRH